LINGVEYPGPEPAASNTKSGFDWNNLISTVGNSFSSIFGGLAGMKNAEASANYRQYQQQKNNGLLWIGLAVVAVIVVVVVMVSRKK
jgi:hypothetical protein